MKIPTRNRFLNKENFDKNWTKIFGRKLFPVHRVFFDRGTQLAQVITGLFRLKIV